MKRNSRTEQDQLCWPAFATANNPPYIKPPRTSKAKGTFIIYRGVGTEEEYVVYKEFPDVKWLCNHF